MRQESAAGLPALVVTYGNTTRKHRPLDREVIVLGRASGCDVALVSPEVAPVHCVIARVPGGWRLRDCTGRGGTRVNGRSVTDVLLFDEDVLQIGTFSFRVRLPARQLPASATVPAVRRLEQSRRNLAHLALRLRQRLRAAERSLLAQGEVDEQADRLRTLHREVEERRRRLEEAEAGLRAEQAKLEERARRVEEAQRQAEQIPAAREEVERRAEELGVQSRNLTRRHLLVQEQAQELAREQEAFHRQRDREAAVDRQVVERLQLVLKVRDAEAAELRARFEAQQAELTALRARQGARDTVMEVSGSSEVQARYASQETLDGVHFRP
jgi:pSer/pThr/pTyr-binding forkhead associated (FHA) protein